MNEIINPGMQEVVIDKDGRQTKSLFRFLMFVRTYIALINNKGFSGTIVTAQLTALGAQGINDFSEWNFNRTNSCYLTAMENFKLIDTVDTSQALVQLLNNSKLWNQNPLRTQHQGTAHAEVDDIWLRFNDVSGDLSNILNDLETQWYEAKEKLPLLVNLTFDLMAREKAVRLGRVMLSRIAGGGRVYRHRDEGAYPHYYERYHIVLQGGKGNLFFCGDEYVEMLTGQIWWFQNLIEHEVYNNSGKDRIHLIVDLKL